MVASSNMGDGTLPIGDVDGGGRAGDPLPASNRVLQARLTSNEARLREHLREIKLRDKQLQELEHRSAATKREVARLRRQLSITRQRLGRIHQGRWWRLGVMLRWALARPWRVALLPGRMLGLLRRTGSSSPGTNIETAMAASTTTHQDPTDRLRIAAILDPFSEESFRPDCDLTRVPASGSDRHLDEHTPDLLLVESAWVGNGGAWRGRITGDNGPSDALVALVAACRDRGIPTVFWNKEDPFHFERFRETARLFDVVFTTDENSVQRYRETLGHDRVGALPFAAQPTLHNPISLAEPRINAPCFAGTYYRNRDPEHLRHLEALLDAARDFGLVIFDRTFGDDRPQFGYPERFHPHIKGYLSYQDVVRAYKTYAVFLNGSSVADSPTMVSRRVFEILGCGTPLVSAPNAAITNFFGDLVPVVSDEADAKEALDALLSDTAVWRQARERAYRLVLQEHTYAHRLAEIGRRTGYEFDPDGRRRVCVIGIADTIEEVRAMAAAIEGQTLPPSGIAIGTILPAGTVRSALPQIPGNAVEVINQERGDDQLRLRYLAEHAPGPWITSVGSLDDDPDLLRDLCLCGAFVDSGVITRAQSAEGEHRYVDSFDPDTALIHKDLATTRAWPRGEAETRGWFQEGVRIYAARTRA